MIAARVIQGAGGRGLPALVLDHPRRVPAPAGPARHRAHLGHHGHRRRARDRARGTDRAAPLLPLALLAAARRRPRRDRRRSSPSCPSRRSGRPGGSTAVGAVLLAGWLVAFLVPISQGPHGAGCRPGRSACSRSRRSSSPSGSGSSRGSDAPLVDMRMMRLRPVWTTNLAALVIGFGMFASFMLVPQFVELPASTGFGFGASVTEAGLYMLPATVGMLLVGPISGRLSSNGRVEGAAASSARSRRASPSSCSPSPTARAGRSTSRCS